MRVRDWFTARCAPSDRRQRIGVWATFWQPAVETQWIDGLDTRPPAHVAALMAAGITPHNWDQYMFVHSSGCLGPDEFRLLDNITQEPVWGPLQGLASSPARLVLFHAAGITPTLLARWMTGQRASSGPAAQSPAQLWARMVVQLTAMTEQGVPLKLAGLYTLAGYTAGEAAQLDQTGSSNLASLRVEAELALPVSTC